MVYAFGSGKKKNSQPMPTNSIVMGPWLHGGWGGKSDGDALGDVRFNAKTAAFYRESIEFPFFQFYLKGKGDGKFPALSRRRRLVGIDEEESSRRARRPI